MIVAVHIDARLGEVVGDDAREHRFKFGILGIVERDVEVFGNVPLREQAHLAHQQGFAVGRQFVVARGELDIDQRIGGIAVQGPRHAGLSTSQCLKIGGVAEVGQQQETLLQVLRIQVRDMRSGSFKKSGDMQERAAVFALRRGIHCDERSNQLGDAMHIRLPAAMGKSIVLFMFLKRDPKIAAEAGIGRGGGKREWFVREQAVQPLGKLLLALHNGLSWGLDDKLARVYHLTIYCCALCGFDSAILSLS